jgi:hypothetical protein
MRGEIQAQDSGERSLQVKKAARAPSLKSRPHALKNIVKSGKTLIIAPLIAGCYQSSTLIATGQYWPAVLCAGAAGLAFLLLAVSLELADAFVEFLLKKQAASVAANDEGS